MRRNFGLALFACLAFLGLAQAQNQFSLGMAYALEPLERFPRIVGTAVFAVPTTIRRTECALLVGNAIVLSEQAQGLGGQPERPTWDRLLLGPAPEGFRGLAISARLLAWSVPWTLAGSAVGLLSDDPWQRSFWLTHSVWTAVNSGIALVGLLGPEPDKNTLRDLLYINAGLDVLYIAGGVFLALQPEARSQGAGWAIALQGAWLLLFDLFNALALENP